MPALENVEAYIKALHRYHTARYLGGADHECGEANRQIAELLEPALFYLTGGFSEARLAKLTAESISAAETEEQINRDNPYDMPEED